MWERKRQRDRGHGHSIAEDCYIDHSLTQLWFHIQGSMTLLPRWEAPNRGPLWATVRTKGRVMGGFCPVPSVAPTGWLWLYDWLCICGYPCTYNFKMPMHSSGSLSVWTASICQPTWAIFLSALAQELLNDGSVKDQYATMEFTDNDLLSFTTASQKNAEK